MYRKISFLKIRNIILFIVTILVIFITFLLVIDLQKGYGHSRYSLKLYQDLYKSDDPFKKIDDLTAAPNFKEIKSEIHDSFLDVIEELQLLKFEESRKSNVISDPRKHYEYNPTLGDLLDVQPDDNMTNLELFQLKISKYEVYQEDEPLVERVLNDMRKLKIISAEEKAGGTQPKLTITFSNGAQALFKPRRMQRTQETDSNHFYFTDYERHNAEIAAYHLDRLLGFRRAMPVTGRLLNMNSELRDVITDEFILNSFFVSPPPANNTCFFTKAKHYSDLEHPICGNNDELEGSLSAFLPDSGELRAFIHPWRRSYRVNDSKIWELDSDYCSNVIHNSTNNETYTEKLLLDLMDSAVFDFLTGNMDRHHFHKLSVFGNDATTLHLDNGRAFGRPFYDEMTILAPIIQCCLIRHSTLETLIRYHNGPTKLSETMRVALGDDPLTPVLWEPHLLALDRRIRIILQTIRHCRSKLDNKL